jgi:hypothetical protein
MNSLQKSEPREVATVPAFNIESIFQLAIEKHGTAETLEKLMGIRRELNAEASKKGFDQAMAAMQSEMPVIVKRKSGAKNAYKYAPLDDIVQQVQPLLHKHGFSFTVTSEVEKDWVKAICKVTHSGGHSDASEFKCPVDARNPMMNDPQRYAGSLTFCKRYAFCNAFGILTGDEDNDGTTKPKANVPAPQGGDVATLKKQLWELTAKIHGGDKNALRQFCVDDCGVDPETPLEELTAKQLESVIFIAKKKV